MKPKALVDLPKKAVEDLSKKERDVLEFIYFNKIVSFPDLHSKDPTYIGALGRLFKASLIDTGYLEDGVKCVCVLGLFDDSKKTSLIQHTSENSVKCNHCGANCLEDYGEVFKNMKGEDVWICTACINFDPGIAIVARKLNLDAQSLGVKLVDSKEDKKDKEDKTEKYVPSHVWETKEESDKAARSPSSFFYRCFKCEIAFDNPEPHEYMGHKYCDACYKEVVIASYGYLE